MVLKTLYKLMAKGVSVANNKAEGLLNKGIDALDRLENPAPAEQAPAEEKRAEEEATISACVGNKNDFTVEIAQGNQTKIITFKKGSKQHEAILEAVIEKASETGAL